MYNLTDILTYLRASTFTTYDFSLKSSCAAPQTPPSKYLKLSLISITFIIVHYISEYLELRNQDQRPERSPAALENCMIDITGKVLTGQDLPCTGCPLHGEEEEEEDDFRLPPPAYELDEVFLAQKTGNAVRVFA